MYLSGYTFIKRQSHYRPKHFDGIAYTCHHKLNSIPTHELCHENTIYQDYYQQKVSSCKGDTKRLFQLVNNLLGRSGETPLPSSEPQCALPVIFNDFFIEKVDRIRSSISPPISSELTTNVSLDSTLSEFSPLTTADVSALISRSAPKTCDLDPVPSSLLKSVHSLHQPIAAIMNESLRTGVFPSAYKTAIVRPLLKKNIT